MVFSSISFLFFFLPLLLLIYYIFPKKYHNEILLIFSIFFYYMGEKEYVILLLLSCFFNYYIGKKIEKKHSKIYLTIGILLNIGILFYYKYTNFFIESTSKLLNHPFETLNIILPLGISFFTFQNLSYLIDVYKKDVPSSKSFRKYTTYITLFPQLVAGPIVRYKDVNDELETRKESFSSFSDGVTRFIIGLGKKVLIADAFYRMYTNIYNSNMSSFSYILVALGFTFQIYYDFSGYSDMAIGLGKMFGFHWKENFNYPLIATSVTDFWRRWHISLSSFFRDYVYIPLGGNRCSNIKNIRNLFLVWTLTGFWHGANWNFILWGIYFFFFLIIEKYCFKKKKIKSHCYTFIVIVISFIIFNITDLKEIMTFLKSMIGIGVPLWNKESIYFLKNNLVLLLIGFIGMSPYLKNKINNKKKGNKWIEIGSMLYLLIIFLLVISSILSNTFNPFIYFRF